MPSGAKKMGSSLLLEVYGMKTDWRKVRVYDKTGGSYVDADKLSDEIKIGIKEMVEWMEDEGDDTPKTFIFQGGKLYSYDHTSGHVGEWDHKMRQWGDAPDDVRSWQAARKAPSIAP